MGSTEFKSFIYYTLVSSEEYRDSNSGPYTSALTYHTVSIAPRCGTLKDRVRTGQLLTDLSRERHGEEELRSRGHVRLLLPDFGANMN